MAEAPDFGRVAKVIFASQVTPELFEVCAFTTASPFSTDRDLCLDPDPVAGIVRTAELDLLDHPHINVELAGRIEQRTDRQLAELLHRLNLKNPRHDRVPREVPLKKVFIDREILEPDVLRVGKLLRAVEHQHRVALRKNRLDLLDSKKLAHYLSLVPLFVKHCLQP